jgi:DNA-binding transcriptional regulator YiaG
MLITEQRHMFAAAGGGLQACTLPGSGYLSGSFAMREDSRVLEVKDTLGQITLVFVCLLPSLVVSAQPPSGCVVSNSNLPLGGWLGFQDVLLVHELATCEYHKALTRDAMLYKQRSLPSSKPRSIAPQYQDVVREVQSAYGLHTTDLAELLEVSRQSVHSWKSEGGSAPGRTSAAKLWRLHQGAAEWRREFSSRSPAWILVSSFRGRSLKKWLSAVAEGEIALSDLVCLIRAETADTADTQPRFSIPATRPRTAFQEYVDTLPDDGSAGRNDDSQS